MIAFFIRFFSRPLLEQEAQFLSDQILKVFNEIESGGRIFPPLIVQKMLIAAEDRRAVNHPGYDFYSIIRASYRFVFYGRREGASTVAQQLVRVLSGRYEISFERKMKEIALACLVSERVPRVVFPSVYLSIAYYGTGIVGYSAACEFLGISSTGCDMGGAAKLIARLKYPQPRVPSAERLSKISRRETYLIYLYCRYQGEGVYDYLDSIFSVESTVTQNAASSLPKGISTGNKKLSK